MITLDLKNIILPKQNNNILLKQLLKKISLRKQGFYENFEKNAEIEKINKFAKQARKKFKHFVLLGIGGSALGAKCLKQALKPYDKTLRILDNIDPSLISQTEKEVNLSKTLFIAVTKSGSTVETAVQFLYFLKKIKEKKLSPQNHFVIATGPQKSFFRETAEKEKIPILNIPENIAGRFSILTPAALLSAKLIGIDIEKILKGAKKMASQFLSANQEKNLLFRLAKIQYNLYKKGKTINVLMPYSNNLKGLNDWYCQLIAESIGKNNKGITPLSALGATDQHSQLQLFTQGPNDKFIIFIEIKNQKPEILIPNPYKITFNELLKIEKYATAQALSRKHRPNITIKIDSITEETLGELIMLFMGSIAFLGEFFKVNPYSQPGVEEVKKIIKKRLQLLTKI